MGKWEETYPTTGALRKALKNARRVGGLKGGQDRVEFIGPLLDAIVDQSYKWSPEQCACFSEKLLCKYVEKDHLELLLAVFGLGKEYEDIKTLIGRRKHLVKNHPDEYEAYPGQYEQSGKFEEQGNDKLEQREKKQLHIVAESLESDHKNNESRQAKQLLASVLSDRDLEKLRIDGVDLPRESDSNNDAVLKRTERISNIGPTDGQFVGRTGILQALEDGFREGCHTQIISGGQGQGKSRTAFEYAHRHETEYQIICWINAWDESCIINSIIDFFNMAKVPYKDIFPDGISELFRRFFATNTDWLVILDNADLALSSQQEMLKKYMPSGNGHFILTGSIGKMPETESNKMEGSKYHFLDAGIDDGWDDAVFIKNALDMEEADNSMRWLTVLCKGHPVPLILATSYIRQSAWVDCATYLHMLEDKGISSENDDLFRVAEAAFEIKMSALDDRRKYFRDQVCLAAQQFLTISAIYSLIDLDLIFLNVVFPIFPEPLNAICANRETRKELVERLRGFGFFEIRENVLHGNSCLNRLSDCYFSIQHKTDMCAAILSKMEKSLLAIAENRYTENPDIVAALSKPYIDRAFHYMHLHGELEDDELSQKYPNSYLIHKVEFP